MQSQPKPLLTAPPPAQLPQQPTQVPQPVPADEPLTPTPDLQERVRQLNEAYGPFWGRPGAS